MKLLLRLTSEVYFITFDYFREWKGVSIKWLGKKKCKLTEKNTTNAELIKVTLR